MASVLFCLKFSHCNRILFPTDSFYIKLYKPPYVAGGVSRTDLFYIAYPKQMQLRLICKMVPVTKHDILSAGFRALLQPVMVGCAHGYSEAIERGIYFLFISCVEKTDQYHTALETLLQCLVLDRGRKYGEVENRDEKVSTLYLVSI